MIWINCLSAVLFLSNCMRGLFILAERKVFMLLQKGGGTDVRDVWIDNANITQVHRHHLNLDLREIIQEGNHRIDLPVDSMSYNEVHLIFLNAVADPLWQMVFNRTAVKSGKWFEEVKRSSSNISGYNTTITDSRQSRYPLCIGTGGCTDPAWAGIWSSEFTDSPLFLFNADPDVPRTLPQPTTEISYIACESKETFNMVHQYDDTYSMSVQGCQEKCTSFPYTLMQTGYKCYCGVVKHGITFSTNSFPDSKCDENCPNSNDRCGARDSKFVAVYEIHEKAPQNLGDIPCSLTSTRYTVTNGEILVSKENILRDFSSHYFYLKGHSIVTSQLFGIGVGSYSMYYNSEDCDNGTRKPYTDTTNETNLKYEFKKYWNTTLIRAVCVWFIPNQLITIDQTFEVNIQICLPTSGKYFFQADYLAVVGVNHTKSASEAETSTTEQDLTTLRDFTITSDIATSNANSITDVTTHVIHSSPTSLGASTITGDIATDNAKSITDVTTHVIHSSPTTLGASTITGDIATDNGQSITDVTTHAIHSSPTTLGASTITYDIVTDNAKSITDFTTHVIYSNNDGNVSQSDPLCTCVCERNGVNITKEELQKKIEKIERHLRVNKKELSSTYRKLISAPDPRPSSKSIGASGVVVMLIFVGVIILMDLSNLQVIVEYWSSLGTHQK